MDENTIRRGMIVRGAVQGVGFRYSTREVAQSLGISGWVRNRADGTVELEARGSTTAVGELLEWLASGPPGASVESVDVSDLDACEPPSRENAGFDIRL